MDGVCPKCGFKHPYNKPSSYTGLVRYTCCLCAHSWVDKPQNPGWFRVAKQIGDAIQKRDD